MEFTRTALSAAGFMGFVRIAELPTTDVPQGPGVCVVLRTGVSPAAYLPTSGAGWFKNKTPTVALASLEAAWVDEAAVLYIGKAGVGARGNRGLRKRLSEYKRFGAGEKIGHWGGRYIWQLVDQAELLVAWKSVVNVDPEDVEAEMLDAFVARFGVRPFANRKLGRSARMRL